MPLVSMKLSRAQVARANLASGPGRVPIARWEEAKFAVPLGATALPARVLTGDLAGEQRLAAALGRHVVAASLRIPARSVQGNRYRRSGLKRMRVLKREHIAYALNVRHHCPPTKQRDRR